MQNWFFPVNNWFFFKKTSDMFQRKANTIMTWEHQKSFVVPQHCLKRSNLQTHIHTNTVGGGDLLAMKVREEAKGWPWDVFFNLFSTCFVVLHLFVWDNASHWTWNSSFHLDRMARNSLGPPVSVSQHWLFCEGPGFLRACAQQPLYSHSPFPGQNSLCILTCGGNC